MSFVVFALPRSRTYWLSRFLSHGDWTCGHEQTRYVRGMDDVRSWLSQDNVGTVETGAAPWWRLALAIRPDLKIVTIRRDPEAVIESVINSMVGVDLDRTIIARNIHQLDHKLNQIERHTECLSVRFEDLARERTCSTLFEYCTGEPHDPRWWEALAPLNLQINMRALVRYELAHQKQFAKMKEVANREVKALKWRCGKSAEMEGMTFQVEPSFEGFWNEAKPLVQNHVVQIGGEVDEWARVNMPMFRALDSIGALQIVTARSNGRLFGYLVTMLSPSMETQSRKIAQPGIFYASPDARGLGPKLQRFAIENVDALLNRLGGYLKDPAGTEQKWLGGELKW